MSIALSNVVTSITRDNFFGTVIDNFYSGNVLFMRLQGKKKAWTSGHQLTIPTQIAGRTQGGSYSGADLFGTAQEDVRQKFTINPSQYYWSSTITGIQAAANRGKEGVVDLMAEEFRSVAEAMRQEMGTDLYLDGTGNSSKALTGLVAHVDDTTNVTTYQGLSRSTYITLKSTLTAQSGALGLDDLATDFDAAQVGSDQPTIMLSTPAVFSIFEALLTATTQYSIAQNSDRYRLTAAGLERGGVTANAGFTALLFRGLPFITDDKCTSGNIYTLNENYLNLYEMTPDSAFAPTSKEGFAHTGWKKPTNQDAITSQFLWYGQLVGTEPRKHARRTGVTS